jgi:hypothetical protein
MAMDQHLVADDATATLNDAARPPNSHSQPVLKPSEILAKLLAEHAELRAMMKATRAIAVRARSGEEVADELRASLHRLGNAVRAHNFREEDTLRNIIHSVNARDPARTTIMTDEHLKEHSRLDTALLGLPGAPVELGGVGVVALIELLRDHLDREESTFLRKDVLCDDDVVSPGGAGA